MKGFMGEFLGTFIMVFIGLATVVNAAVIEVYTGLFQVAALWGLGLTVAIMITRSMSGAHLNPAVTVAFASCQGFSWKLVPGYIIAQCLGAFLAAAVVYLLFNNAITSYEIGHQMTRGDAETVRSAMVFGEYYPNPAADHVSLGRIGMREAALAEGLGTGFLTFIIFSLIRIKDLPSWLIPLLIGMTLTVLISLLAPLSMAGFNPARDFMPRLFSSFVGWERLPFTHNGMGWLVVYIIAPMVGAQLGGIASLLTRVNKD